MTAEMTSIADGIFRDVGQTIHTAVSIPDFEGEAAQAVRQKLASVLMRTDVLAECVLQLGYTATDAESVVKQYVAAPDNLKKVPGLDELGHWAGSGGPRDVVRDITISGGDITRVVVEDTKKGDIRHSGFEGIAGALVPGGIFGPVFDLHTQYAQSATTSLQSIQDHVDSLPTIDAVRSGADVSITLSRSVFLDGKSIFSETDLSADPVARELSKLSSYGTDSTSLSHALSAQRASLDAEAAKKAAEQAAAAEKEKEEKKEEPKKKSAAPAAAAPRVGGGGGGAPFGGGGSAPRLNLGGPGGMTPGGLGGAGGTGLPEGLTRIDSLPGMSTDAEDPDGLIDIDALFERFSEENASAASSDAGGSYDGTGTAEEVYPKVPEGYVFTGYDPDGTLVFKAIPEGAEPIYDERGNTIGYWPPPQEPSAQEPAPVPTQSEPAASTAQSATQETDPATTPTATTSPDTRDDVGGGTRVTDPDGDVDQGKEGAEDPDDAEVSGRTAATV